MGYSYDMSGRLACDACGSTGKTRKRTCPHKVHYAGGGSLPYCYPSALCADCYATRKATLHAGCAERAAARTADEAAKHARLVAGELEVASAFGTWHATVPEGWVGVIFRGTAANEAYRLIAADHYDPTSRRYMSEYPDARPWSDPMTTKAVTW